MMRPRPDERGAAAVVLAVMISVLVVFAAFAVDLGMQRVARRDMQALADVIALDMVRQLDGRTQAVIKATNDWRGGLEKTLRRNLNLSGTPTISTQQEQRDAVATVAGEPLTVRVRMGLLDPVTGAFTDTIPYPDVPNAVRVTTATSVDFAFTSGSGGVSRTAYAQTEANACFSVGSFLAGLNEDPDSLVALLNPILGDTDLTVASYQGLANSDISLLQLIQASDINVGTLEGLLSASDISVADIFLASAEVLTDEKGAANLLNAELLERLAGLTLVGDVTIPIGNLIDLTTAGDGALDANFNLLDLVAGAVSFANGTNFAGVHPLDLDLPNLASATSSVTIIEAPHLACGRAGAVARTAQVNVNAGGMVGSTVLLPLGGTLTVGGPLTVSAGIGQATGTLGEVTCNPDVIPINVATAVSSASVALPLAITGDDIGLSSNVPGIPGLLTADISLGQTINAALPTDPSSTQLLRWEIPSDTYGTVKSTTGSSTTLSPVNISTTTALVISDIRIAGVPLSQVKIGIPPLEVPIGAVLEATVRELTTTLVNGLLGPVGAVTAIISGVVSSTVNPLIADLNVLIDQLTSVLGLDLAGADVRVLPYAKCNAPVLRG